LNKPYLVASFQLRDLWEVETSPNNIPVEVSSTRKLNNMKVLMRRYFIKKIQKLFKIIYISMWI
jgi:hypothetical protein